MTPEQVTSVLNGRWKLLITDNIICAPEGKEWNAHFHPDGAKICQIYELNGMEWVVFFVFDLHRLKSVKMSPWRDATKQFLKEISEGLISKFGRPIETEEKACPGLVSDKHSIPMDGFEQRWVADGTAVSLSARSVCKYESFDSWVARERDGQEFVTLVYSTVPESLKNNL